ncbi:MAG TPA: LuxR C-terminal-related transcriptional regulator [Acidimicrobiales bacterium]|nr:LuxR C-terminal-related transcriptional regulator [Acidimicrobiales bacterium]
MGDVGDPNDRPVSGLPTSALLKAKLRAPVVPDHYVRRPRLLRLLDEAVEQPLTLVVAPAGVGKTVLLAGWAAETHVATGWLSLDESDRDPSQLWSGVIAALDRLAPGCADAALARLWRPGGLAGVVEELLDGLDTRAGPPVVLIVDDLHIADGDDVARSLATFLLHLPSWLHVVGLSRRKPRLPLERMRAGAQVGEVNLAELRFCRHEAQEMLARLAPSLPEEWIETTAAQADGWAAGLQLAALAARAQQARGDAGVPAAGHEMLVDDYVWGEVLGSEDRDLVDVLLDVAVVERVSARLARALSGRQDAGAVLLQAEARGLFVSRLGQAGWFELHALVRRTLLAELERNAPQRLAERHARAARWFQVAGETPRALAHWVAAGRPRDALRLLAASHAELYDSGREATVVRTIAAIPAEEAAADLDAMIDYAWCHLLVSRSRFTQLVEEMTWWAQRSPPSELTRARLEMMQSMAATIGGEWDEGGRLARRGMAELGQSWWQDPLGRFGWNMVAREVALSESWDDGSDEVREAGHALGRLPERRLTFEGTRALGLALAGRPADALRVAAGVRRAAEVASMTILRAELAVAEAIAHRDLGDHGRAVPELESLASAPAETMLFCRVLACAELVQAHLDRGDVDAAWQVLAEGEALVEAESFGRGGRTWLARAGTLLALATGDLDAAGRWAASVDDPFWGGVCAARVHLAGGRAAEASSSLLESTPRCPRHEVVLDLLRARVVADADVSARCVEAAVDLATRHGMLQTVASEGREVVELVEHAAWRAPPDWLDLLRRRATGHDPGSPVVRIDLVEPLTERERDILRFLPSRLTIREIADERYVSVNTLKFHLKAIYRKLGVGSRAEAAELARHMTEVDRQG